MRDERRMFVQGLIDDMIEAEPGYSEEEAVIDLVTDILLWADLEHVGMTDDLISSVEMHLESEKESGDEEDEDEDDGEE